MNILQPLETEGCPATAWTFGGSCKHCAQHQQHCAKQQQHWAVFAAAKQCAAAVAVLNCSDVLHMILSICALRSVMQCNVMLSNNTVALVFCCQVGVNCATKSLMLLCCVAKWYAASFVLYLVLWCCAVNQLCYKVTHAAVLLWRQGDTG